ncbi:unnamed protein product [Miscanthus lutarioriparius]|uniref:Uncharacterized protein n=1 Tax=Miscanthus lutarioriparius TaxID=422564 RepID=A0A811N5M9_9POAL|nr:unnamed protein product [Miscanthus lutarioriparius]
MSRKFLSLIVNEQTPGHKTLRCIDLTRQKFFYDAPPPPPTDGSDGSAGGARDAATSRPAAASRSVGRVCLPRPSFTFRPGDSNASDEWGMHCFPLGDRKVICADQSGLAFVFDAETRIVGAMPSLGRPKRMPFSLPNNTDDLW